MFCVLKLLYLIIFYLLNNMYRMIHLKLGVILTKLNFFPNLFLTSFILTVTNFSLSLPQTLVNLELTTLLLH